MDGYGKCHECENFGTMECPTSSKCMAFDDRPYFKQKPVKKFFLFRLMRRHDYEYAHKHKVNNDMNNLSQKIKLDDNGGYIDIRGVSNSYTYIDVIKNRGNGIILGITPNGLHAYKIIDGVQTQIF